MAEPLWTLTFGQYKGKDIEDLPNSYLEWLLEQEWFESKYPIGYRAVRREMEYREAHNILVGAARP